MKEQSDRLARQSDEETRHTVTHSPPPSAATFFTLTLDENPLKEFVELPDEALEGGLWFSNVLCGVLRDALEMVGPCLFQCSICCGSQGCSIAQIQMQVEVG